MEAVKIQGRKSYIDWLKALAIIGVIVDHVTTEWMLPELSAPRLGTYVFFYGFARYCVPIFFMATGVLLLNPEKELSVKDVVCRKIPHILIAAFCYGLVYKVLRVYLSGNYEGILPFIKSYLVDFVTGKMEFHFWYIYALIGVYLSIPILRQFIKNAPRKTIEYFLVVWLIVNLFYLLGVNGYLTCFYYMFDQFHFMGIFTGYLGFTVLGYYLDRSAISRKGQRLITVIGVVWTLAAVCLSVYDLKMYGAVRVEYLALYSPCAVFLSVGLFLWAKNRAFREESRGYQWWCGIGRNTLGIYFIHMVFIIAFMQTGVVNVCRYPIIDVVLYSLVILLASYVIAMILRKLPIIGKWL